MESKTQAVPLAIYTYSIAHLSPCEKVKFYYTLKGRDNKIGVLKTTNTAQLGKGVLLAPKESWQKIAHFLTEWECSYRQRIVFGSEEVLQ